jgi:hypothetical protein
MSQRITFHADTPLQALLVEQALLLARQLQATAEAAPDGQILARQAVQAQAEAAEKKGVRPHLRLRTPPLVQGHHQP